MAKFFPWLICALAFLVWRNGRSSLNLLTLLDYPLAYYSHGDFDEKCHVAKHEGVRFCEDVVFWDHLNAAGKLDDRKLILSCDPHRKGWNTVMGPLRDPEPRGALWLFDPESRQKGVQETFRRITLQGYPSEHDFHPLGLDIWPSHSRNASTLFVVNHARARTVIEQFILSPSAPTTAKWIRTLTHKYFVSPNALAMTSPSSFYVTNDHLMTRRLPGLFGKVLPLTETLLSLPLGWLAHVSVEDTAVATIKHSLIKFGIPFANGVALSPDHKTVAVASTTLSSVTFYTRSPSTNLLLQEYTVPLPFCVDNIAFDDSGTLIVTGHPHFPSLVRVAANQTPDAVAPSWVMALSPRTADPEVGSPSLGIPPKVYDVKAPVPASSRVPAVLSHEAETLFQSNGTAFSSSSTGLRDAASGVVYVTGLYEEGILVCRP